MKITFHSANKSIIKCLLIYMGKLDNKQQQLLQIKRFMKKGTFNKQKVIILENRFNMVNLIKRNSFRK